MPLPELREELDLLSGGTLPDGQPIWRLHDPACNRFYSIDWPTFEILRRWSFPDAESIAESVGRETTLRITQHDVENVLAFLLENQLINPTHASNARLMAKQLAQKKQDWLHWLLHHYLFFRIPLWRPDTWLECWLPIAHALFSRSFLGLTCVALLLGLSQVARQWDFFLTSLVDTFTWQGLAAYGTAIIFVKLLHELGHAFTAKQFGCRVPSMGIAFLVLWPMAYTDTNEAWRLVNHRHRLRIAAAGIITELIIAAWATFAWAFLPEGTLKQIAFTLATTSWIATIAINASPFMRFDGYFILSDFLNIPNLHERCSALARWKLREWLFNLKEVKPEFMPAHRERWLILFAWFTWLYRLTIFFGIALLVYHFFIKLIGILLFAIEISWFIIMPIQKELCAWKQRWSVIKKQRRAWVSASLMLLVISAFFLPWPGRIPVMGLLKPVESWTFFAPGTTHIQHLPYSENSPITKGEWLMGLQAPSLLARRDGLLARIDTLRWQAAAIQFDNENRNRLQSTQEEFTTAQTELASVEEELVRYQARAPFSGTLRDIDPDLQTGQWLSAHEPIAHLIGQGQRVETYLDETQIQRVQIGNRGWFMTQAGAGPLLTLRITNIDRDTSRVLNNPALSASAGGHVLTRPLKDQLIPEQAMYLVTLDVETPAPELTNRTWRGWVVIEAEPESPGLYYLRSALAVLIREAGL